MSSNQAVILAGGQGTRLRPFTNVLPKPLVPVGNMPIAEVIVSQLRDAGFKNILMATGYLSDLIEAYFENGRKFGVNIKYFKEKKPLGTAGVIKKINSICSDVVVINGDTLSDIDLKKLFDFHKKNKGIATIAVKERVVKTDFGVIEFDNKNVLTDYIEKPEHRSFVSMGVNIINKKCQKYIKSGEFIGMPELMLRLSEKGEKVYCYKTKNMWLDLGRIDDLQKAQDIFQKNKNKFLKKRK